MIGIPEFFSSGPNPLPISPDEIQLVSLIGFILVSMVYCCGTLNRKPEKVLEMMMESGGGHPQLRKAVAFVRDALGKHPSLAYEKWFLERSEFGDLTRQWKATEPG